MKIRNIVISGGTHGNEYTGIFLLKKLELLDLNSRWPNLNIDLMLSNPKAYEKCVRFIDHDLNRSFHSEELRNSQLAGYEYDRAKVINNVIGPKGNSKTDFIIDIHTTTSNMGTSIILDEKDSNTNAVNFQISAHLKNVLPSVAILYQPADIYSNDKSNQDLPYLDSISTYGLTCEIGPIPNGIVRHDIIQQAESFVFATLDFLDLMNNEEEFAEYSEVEVFQQEKFVNYPTDDQGRILAYIHEEFQDKDFQLLEKGTPILKTLDNKTIYYDEEDEYYPVFINEAAYYNKKLAFGLAKKRVLDLKNI